MQLSKSSSRQEDDAAPICALPPEIERALVTMGCAVAGLWIYARAWRLVMTQLLPGWYYVTASFLTVCLLRWWYGKIPISPVVRAELTAVCRDWTAPARCCANARHLSAWQVYREFCVSAGVLLHYGSYGPCLPWFWRGLFVVPATATYHYASYIAEESIPLQPVLVLAAVFLGSMFLTHLANTLMHRYFAHRCFETSRAGTIALACFCALGTKPMWWVSTHRRHHKHADQKQDPHSPITKGFLYAYVGWITDRENFKTRPAFVHDWVRDCPELLLVDLFHSSITPWLHTILLGSIAQAGLGYARWAGFDLKALRFLADTAMGTALLGKVFAVHMSFLFNAYAHTHSVERGTNDCAAFDVKSSWFACMSSGENLHAQHHTHPALATNFKSPGWHKDWVYGFICVLEKLGLVWEVKTCCL